MTEDDLFKLQWDALYESTENNPYLPYKTSATLNKSLLTNNKRVIKAINEILEKAETASQTVIDFSSRFNNIMGDEMSDPTLLANLREIDENFFKAIVKIYNDLKSGSANADAIQRLEEADEEINEAITLLNQRLATLEESMEDFEEICEVDTDLQAIMLSHTPKNKQCIDLYVNGIHYSSNSFNLYSDRLSWLLNENNGGFLLEDGFEVLVKYNYYKESQSNG